MTLGSFGSVESPGLVESPITLGSFESVESPGSFKVSESLWISDSPELPEFSVPVSTEPSSELLHAVSENALSKRSIASFIASIFSSSV